MIVVFPDHTACTDPGNIIGGRGVQAHPPQVFLVLNLIYRSPMGSKTPEGVQHFFLGGDPLMKTHSSDVLLKV